MMVVFGKPNDTKRDSRRVRAVPDVVTNGVVEFNRGVWL